MRQNHVHVLRAGDRFEVDGETVGEQQRFTLGEVGRDVLVVNRRNHGVRSGDENHVGSLDGLGGVHDLEAELLGDFTGLRLRVEADDDLEAAVLEVERVGMALRAEADHGEGFLLERSDRGVLGGIDLRGHGCSVGWFDLGHAAAIGANGGAAHWRGGGGWSSNNLRTVATCSSRLAGLRSPSGYFPSVVIAPSSATFRQPDELHPLPTAGFHRRRLRGPRRAESLSHRRAGRGGAPRRGHRTSTPANSSACSARPAAGSPRCSTSSAASTCRPPAS